MRRNLMRTVLGPILIGVLAACAPVSTVPAPEELRLGLDACEYCHMSIDDPDRAAQWVESDGHAHKFDEPGCLLAWLQGHPETTGAAFVGDFEGSGWLPADQARLVRGAVRTSMGFDIVAFRNPDAARSSADRPGAVLRSWEQIRQEGVKDVHAR